MTDRFIPTIGASGFFRIASPFVVPPGERYTCKAIRKMSEHRSLGSDVFKEFYESMGIGEDVYLEDNQVDAEIVSLMADGGRWMYVPSRFLLGYPDMNGIPYRGMALHVKLPAFPVSQDFSAAIQQIQDAVQAALGVNSAVVPVETSRTTLVPSSKHLLLRSKRQTLSTGSTPTTRAVYWQNAYDDLLVKFNALQEAMTAQPY